MVVIIGTIVAAQSHGTEATAKTISNLLNYCTTHPDKVICYHASGIILEVYSNTLYLSKREADSRAGGYFFMGSKHDNQ
eukprot:2156129-Ditylum_brightwellii.AAC.1